jgi:hypothetical protein
MRCPLLLSTMRCCLDNVLLPQQLSDIAHPFFCYINLWKVSLLPFPYATSCIYT